MLLLALSKLDIIIIRTRLLETFWPNTKLVDTITLEVISDLEILSIWIQIPSLNMIPLLVQINMPLILLEERLGLSQVPKMITILLRIHLFGIIQFISELVNILHNILELKKLEFHMVDNSELKLEILSMVPNGLSVLKIASLVQIKLLVLSHLRETQIQLI